MQLDQEILLSNLHTPCRFWTGGLVARGVLSVTCWSSRAKRRQHRDALPAGTHTWHVACSSSLRSMTTALQDCSSLSTLSSVLYGCTTTSPVACGHTAQLSKVLAGNASLVSTAIREPKPAPVPPARLCKSRKPPKRSQASTSRLALSMTAVAQRAPW